MPSTISIDRDVKRTLDLRLARGEISLTEYRKILVEIGADAPINQSDPTLSFGSVVHQVDDLVIHERGLVVAGRKKSFDDIVSIEGGTSEFSINVLARSRRSYISIVFHNGDSYYIDEERAYLGNKRHEAISRAVALLKHQTFPIRVRKFLLELSNAGELEIGKETKGPLPNLLFGGVKAVANFVSGTPPLGPIHLSIHGTLRSPMTTVKISKCREHGVLELGVSRYNYVNSSEVYAIETKPILLASENRSRAVYFTIVHAAGADVVMSVLDWFAKGDNEQPSA